MEPTLNVPMHMITGRVGNYLGFGYGIYNGEKAWTDRQWIRIKDFTDSGLRQFYYPPDPAGGLNSHNWSFLRPHASLTLESGATTLELPADFAGVEGPVVFSAGQAVAALPCPVMNEGYVRELAVRFPNATGRPIACAVSPLKGTTAGRSPRAELLVHPTADQEYTVGIQYYLAANALTAANPWAYGGTMHAETIIASCLAVAELRLNDVKGVHHQTFLERLAASIAMDRRMKAQDLGYVGDSSDNLFHSHRRHGYHAGSVTFNGTEY